MEKRAALGRPGAPCESVRVSRVRRGDTWRRRRLLATGYDSAVHCEPLARTGARLLWGYDIGDAWAMIGETGGAPPGTLVLDAPSGGGIALRGLRQAQPVHYV